MEPTHSPDTYEAADSVGLLRRRWRLIVAVTLIGGLGGFGYVMAGAKTYKATAVVNVVPTASDQPNLITGNGNATASLNLATEAQTVISTGPATLAARMLHSSLPPYQLAKQIAVTVPPNSSVLDIACTQSTPTAAADCANDFAKAYLQNRQNAATADVNGQLDALSAQVSQLNAEIDALNVKIGKLARNSPQRAADDRQLISLKSRLGKLTQDNGILNGQLAHTTGGSVITTATPPGKPASPLLSLMLPSGLGAGLIIGWFAAYLVDRRDRRIHNATHAERMLGVPALLELPAGAFGREVTIAPGRSKTGQAFTDLAHGVTTALGEGNHVVLVAGATPGPAGSVVAANLAVTLARTHSEVVLVCTDMKNDVGPKLLGLSGGPGLADLIGGGATVRDVVQGPTGMPGLWVIPPGADPSAAASSLQHDAGHSLISQLRRDARYVIISAQAGGDGTDAFGLAEFADAAVVAVEVARSTKAEAVGCVRRLRQIRTPILGTAILPALSRRIAVRAPRQGQQPGARAGRG